MYALSVHVIDGIATATAYADDLDDTLLLYSGTEVEDTAIVAIIAVAVVGGYIEI